MANNLYIKNQLERLLEQQTPYSIQEAWRLLIEFAEQNRLDALFIEVLQNSKNFKICSQKSEIGIISHEEFFEILEHNNTLLKQIFSEINFEKLYYREGYFYGASKKINISEIKNSIENDSFEVALQKVQASIPQGPWIGDIQQDLNNFISTHLIADKDDLEKGLISKEDYESRWREPLLGHFKDILQYTIEGRKLLNNNLKKDLILSDKI